MSLKYRFQRFQIGEHDIQLKLLRDLEQFSDPENSAKHLGISRAAWPLFGMVWASSEAMANYLLDYDFSDRKILEIGCGMALISHTLNAMGANISAMDIHPVVGEFLSDNTELNGTKDIPFHNASWSDPDVELGQFDLIVGSDILYEPKHVKHLADFIQRHAKDRSEVIIVDPDRGQGGAFHESMLQLGFDCRGFRPDTEDHLGIEYSGRGYRYFR